MIYPLIMFFDILINKDYFNVSSALMTLFISLSVVLIYKSESKKGILD
jgi:hypothetical protein